MGLSNTQRSRAARHPAALAGGFFAAGAAAGSHLAVGWEALLACLVFCAFLFPWAAGSRRGWAVVSAAFLLAGAFSVSVSSVPPPPDRIVSLFERGVVASGEPVIIEGSMPNGFELLPDARIIDIEAERITVRGERISCSGTVRAYVAVRGREADAELRSLGLKAGSWISVGAVIAREEKYYNPGGFGFLDHLEREGLDAVATVKSPMLVEKTGEGSGSVRGLAAAARNSLASGILSALDQPASGIALASLLGNRHFLTKEAGESYRAGGTFHILVVSGLHVTLAGGTCLWLLSAAGAGRLASLSASMAVVWCFAFVSGLGTPVVRASVMFAFVAVGIAIRRGASGLNALGAAVLLIATLDPRSVLDPSFQLTALSVAAITGFALPMIDKFRSVGAWHPDAARPLPPRVGPLLTSFAECLYWNEEAWRIARDRAVWDCEIRKSPLAKKLSGRLVQKALRTAFEGAALTLSVQAALLPLQIWYFHRIAPAGVLLNLAAGLFLGTFASLASAASILSLLSETLGASLASAASGITDLWLAFQNAAAAAGGQFRIPVYSGWMKPIYILYFIPALHFLVSMNRWDPFSSNGASMRLTTASAAAAVLLAAVMTFHPFSAPAADGKLSVTFLDVGQGDSFFVRFPDGGTALIDGGGTRRLEAGDAAGDNAAFEPDRRDVGETVVSEYLWEMGYSEIGLVVLTHPDTDHIRGLVDIVRNFHVGTLIAGIQAESTPDQRDLFGIAAERGVPVRTVASGSSVRYGGALIEVLASGDLPAGCGESANDRSIVVAITYGSRRFLFTGDIERCAESALSRARARLSADVVKVPHHGSRTSSSPLFVRSAGADYAVVSAGRRSQFGHPHGEVVERWRRSGARVLSTADCGAVTVTTDGSRLEVDCFLDRPR